MGKAAREAGLWQHVVVHSGQHYDECLSGIFFSELDMPLPHHHLGIGSGSHAAMTAAALVGMEQVLQAEKPDALLVYGDTNTTLAGAIAASKLHIPVIHVEAGIRMLPKTMPEEINRVLTDHISTLFCCCSQHEADCLGREGLHDNVHVTGDVMYDLFLKMRPRLSPADVCRRYGVSPNQFAILTLHRDYNVDDKEILTGILDAVSDLANTMPVIFFVHPRTQSRIDQFGLGSKLAHCQCVPPEGYLALMSLVEACAFVMTDSGGLQKEAYYAGKRAIVVMPDTGWRALVACGWNILAKPNAHSLRLATAQMLHENQPTYVSDIYGTGQAACRIVASVEALLRGE